MDNYNIIRNRIKQFIRKYYLNQIIKGGLLTLTIVGMMFFVFVLPESQFYFNETVRMGLFFLFIGLTIGLAGTYIFLPISKLLKIKKGINEHEAAKIIGNHFTEVKDKLLNVIQLEEKYKISDREAELLKASIEQRSRQLTGVPFKKAVDLSKNRTWLVRFGGIIILLAAGFFLFPRSFTDPAERIVNYNRQYEKPQAFYFKIDNDSLEAVQNRDFTVQFSTTGDEIPEKVYVNTGGNRIMADKVSRNAFEYTFKGLNSNKYFFLQSGKIESKKYHIKVRPLPIILEFEVLLNYPDYTNKEDEKIKNSGDIFIPEGTKAQWVFYTRDLSDLFFEIGGQKHQLKANQSNKFEFGRQLFKDTRYTVYGENQFLSSPDTVSYRINIIKDQYPKISIKQDSDSIDIDRNFFTGLIQDDYGLTKLLFHQTIIKKNDTIRTDSPIDILPNSKQQFYYSTSFDSLNLQSSDMVKYYFEVFDNDKINGYKSTQSRIFTYKQPSAQDIERRSEKSEKQINDQLKKNLGKAEDMDRRLEEMRRDLMNKKNLNWKDKEKLNDAMKGLEELEQNLKSIKNKSESNRKFEEQFDKSDKELLDKQKQLEDLMDKVLDEEVKKLMDEIRKMMEELDKDKMNDLLNKMKMSNKSMKQQLDRSIELFKQLQFQKDLQESIEKAKELAGEQQKLKEKTGKTPRKGLEEISGQEEELRKQTDSLSQKLDKLEQEDKELQNSNGFKAPKKDTEGIRKKMRESIEELNQRNKNKAGDKMKEAEDKLFKLSKNLKAQQQSMQREQLGEDIDNLKQILENLVDISFEQETLISNFKSTNNNDPKYVKKIQEQFTLKDKLGKVKDSLKALSKRQAMIEPFVMREIESIEKNMEKSINHLKERNTRSGTSRQQYVMTHVNNLSLLLAEALDNMQQNMQAMGSGGGQSKSQGIPKMSEIRKMQQQLQKQLKEMKKGMQNGKKGQSKPGMSEKMARMAAKQAAIRKKLQQYRKELMKEGKGDQGLNKSIKKMDQNETDFVNKRITQQMIERQKQIISRLLESEKAERKQDKQKERKAEQAKSYEKSNPNGFLEYKEIKTNNKEILKTIPPEMHPYYRERINNYFIEEKTQNKDE